MSTRKPKHGGARAGAGRPARDPGDVRAVRITVFATPSEARALRELAARLDVSCSDVLREAALAMRGASGGK